MLVSEYTEYDALGLAELVANGDISAEELVDCAEQQYHNKNPALNAVVTPMWDQAREALRDELLFQNNRMNNVQLCSTMCLGVAFTVAVEGVMPPESSHFLVNMYSSCIGAAILCLSASLWLSFVLIRRLNLYTAGIMHAMIDMERVKVRVTPPVYEYCICRAACVDTNSMPS